MVSSAVAVLDRTRSLCRLRDELPAPASAHLDQLIAELDADALLDDARSVAVRSGIDVLLELEDVTNQFL